MERAILEKHLAECEAHVALGAHHVEQQQALILKLESTRCDAAAARALLRLLEELQVEHVSHRDRLRRSPTMRQERTVQASIFDLFADHEIGRELKAMSQWLDEHRELIGLAAEDLRRHGVKETGREGLPAESVLRCALLKQHRQLSYEELAFHLEDSASFRAFARLPLSWTPKKSVLHRTISAIRA